MKKDTNITIDMDLWRAFRGWAIARGSTASREIERLIREEMTRVSTAPPPPLQKEEHSS